MQLDHRSIKVQARVAMGECHPRPWQITLLFFLLVTVLPNVLYEIFQADLITLIMTTLESTATGGSLLDSVLIGLFVTLVATLVSMIVQFGYSLWALRCWRHEEGNGFFSLFDGFGSVGRILLANVLVVIYTFFWLMLLLTAAIPIASSFAAGDSSVLFLVLAVFYTVAVVIAISLIVLRYSLVPFVLADRPELSAFRAVSLATSLIRNHIWKLFRLYLSFLWLYILSNLLSIVASLLVVHLTSALTLANFLDPWNLLLIINQPLPYWIGLAATFLVALVLTPYITVSTAGFYHNLTQPSQPSVGTYNIDIY